MAQGTSEQCRDIVLRHATAGWGTEPHWRLVWDQTCAAGLAYHFCGWPEAVIGLDAAKEFNAELFIGFPRLEQTIDAVVADNQDVVYRHRLRGAHEGPFLGVAPTYRTVDITGMTWSRLRDGRITQQWYELNHAELQRQLGLLPE